MRARSSTARLLHVLAFHNFPAAPPLKTTRENLSAYTEGNHTCSLPTAVQLELNRIKSTAVPSVPPLFPRQMNVSRLSFTWSALEVKLGQHRCARGQGTRDCLGALVVDAAPPQVQGGQHRCARLQRLCDCLGPLWTDVIGAQGSTPPSTSGPTRSGCRRRVGGSGPSNWRSRIMPESMIGRCMRRAELSDACRGEGCMWRRGI